MAPSHVAAFQKFKARIPNRLEADIAFGLFMQSESIWAATEGDPSEIRYRRYQEQFLTDHEIERFAQQARALLSDFGGAAVAVKRAEFLQENLEQYETAARAGHSSFRKWGVVEAVAGAFFWTVLLIVISFVLKYNGIDLIEVYQKVAGH